MEEKIEKPSYKELLNDVKKHRKLYYKVLPITFVISAIIMLSIPNYYSCTVMLAPELSSMGAKSSSGLASLASSFGINLGGANAGADALLPTLYPDLMNSVTFRASLFPIQVQREDEDSTMTYYDYLKDGQKAPWWSMAMKATFDGLASLLGADKEKESSKVNTFKLTKEQTKIVKTMEKKVSCDVDKKTMVITINVVDQDPLICATIADSVQMKLQKFITDYRTSKARVDLEYNKKIFEEARTRYEKARDAYAHFSDSHRDVSSQRGQTKQADLQNEMNIRQQIMQQVIAQMQQADMKVQQETPAFTTLQPATVPVRKDGPKRARTCLIFLFLAFIGITVYAIHKEGHLIPLFMSDDDEDVE
jgi:predicted XRE-type DNA-binding protein